MNTSGCDGQFAITCHKANEKKELPMKSLMSVTCGGPEKLELVDQPTPEPGSGEVLIEVKAAGVNYPDTLIIRDLYQFKPPRPFTPEPKFPAL